MTAPVQQEQQFDVDGVFDSAGTGSGAPSFGWPLQTDPRKADRMVPVIGGSIQGEITDIYMTVVKDPDKDNAPKLDKNGKQQPQVNLTIQTSLRNWEGVKSIPLNDPKDANSGPKELSEDTGERRIYVKFRMLDAIAKAIKASEQKTGGPRQGAKIAVKVSGLEYSSNQMRHPLPDYEARYVPPVAPAPTDAAWDAAVQPQAAAPAALVAHHAASAATEAAWAGAAPASAGGWSDEPPF